MSGTKDPDSPTGNAVSVPLIRRLLQFARNHRRGFLLSAGLLLALSGLRVTVPILIGRTIDALLGPDASGPAADRFRSLLVMTGILSAIAVAAFVLKSIQLAVINRTGQAVIHDLRRAVHRHILNRSLSFFDRKPVGTLVTRVTNDVDTLNEFFTSGLDVLVTDATQISLIVIVLFAIDWRMALMILLLVPFILAWAFFFQRQARQLFREVRGKVAGLNAFMNESLTGIRVIQSFRRESAFDEKFRQRNEELRHVHLGTVRNFSLFYPGMEFLPAVGRALILILGNELVLEGELGVGDLVTFWFYLTLFIEPLRELADRYNILQAAVASGERVFRVLDDRTALPIATHPIPVFSVRGEVTFENVTFSYDGRRNVLEDISFHVRAGTHLALVGPTGSGKSTLINLLCRFYDPSGGRVLIDGNDVREFEPDALRRQIGVVLQDVFLFAGTVRDNLTLGRTDLDDATLWAAADVVQARRVIEALGGLGAPIAERGATLSAGEKQLLAFARTLAHDPKILILDEATANIDTVTEAQLQEALTKVIAGRTAILIAHRLSTIQQCEHILLVHHGRIRERGSHAELLDQDGIYARLHRLQWS